MSAKFLAEAIMLQAIEDLFSKKYKPTSIAFFKGEGFNACADAADIRLDDQIKLLNIVNGILKSRPRVSRSKNKIRGLEKEASYVRSNNLQG